MHGREVNRLAGGANSIRYHPLCGVRQAAHTRFTGEPPLFCLLIAAALPFFAPSLPFLSTVSHTLPPDCIIIYSLLFPVVAGCLFILAQSSRGRLPLPTPLASLRLHLISWYSRLLGPDGRTSPAFRTLCVSFITIHYHACNT
jgi:hypothetical protein